jgi:hypothetical protein
MPDRKNAFWIGHLLVVLAVTCAWAPPVRADQEAVLRADLAGEIRDALAAPAMADALPEGMRIGSIQVETRRVVVRIDGADGPSGRVVLSALPRASGTTGGWFAVEKTTGSTAALDAGRLARFGERLAARLDTDPWMAIQATPSRDDGSDFHFPRGFVIVKGAVHLLLVLGMLAWCVVLLLGPRRQADDAPTTTD